MATSILQRVPAGFIDPDFTPGDFATTDLLAPYEPSWRVRINVAGTWRYYATVSQYQDLTHAYHGMIAEGHEPTISREMTDPIFRYQETQTTSLALVNPFNATTLTAPLNAAYVGDLRGAAIEIDRFDMRTGFTLMRFVGSVTQARLGNGLLFIEAKSIKREVLEDQIPKLKITTELFPDAPEQSVGQVVPVIVGAAVNVPVWPIVDDQINGKFYGLAPLAVGGGTIQINALKRSVPGSAEFELFGGSEYSTSLLLFPGFTTVVFAKRPQQWGGDALLNLTADVSCVAARDRHPVWVRAAMLKNTQWGLGQSIDMASFETAAAAIDAIPGNPLRLDGVMLEQRRAEEWLADAGMVRGCMLGLTREGKWTESVDVQRAASIILRDGPGDGIRNLTRCENRQRRPENERIKRVVLGYRRDPFDDRTVGEQTFAVETDQTKGKDKPIRNVLIRDHTAARATGWYLSKRIRWAEETVEAGALQDTREADLADIATLGYAPMAYAGAIMETLRLDDDLTEIGFKFQGGSQADYDAIYSNATGTLPDDPPGGLLTDYTRTVPDPAVDLTILSEGVGRNASGQDIAAVRLGFTTPTINCSGFKIGWRFTGETEWNVSGVVNATGAQTYRLAPLVTGKAHDFAVFTVNEPGNLSSTPETEGEDLISSHQTKVDDVPPTNPTGLTALVGTGSTVRIRWDAPPEFSATGDYDETYIHFTTAGGTDADFANLSTTLIAKIRGTTFVHATATQGTQGWYRVRHEDYSGNVTLITASPTATATPTGAAQGTTPATPAAPTLLSSGTYQGTVAPGDADGATHAFAVVTVAALPAEAAYVETLARTFGVTTWTSVGQSYAAGGGSLRIDGGLPGWRYEIAQRAVNAFGRASAESATLTFTAPGDEIAPSIPTGLSVDSSKLTVITVKCTLGSERDQSGLEYQIRTSPSNEDDNGAGSVLKSGSVGVINIGGVTTFTIDVSSLTYGTTYYVRARSKDFTGNPTPVDGAGAKWTATASFVVSKAQTIDYGPQTVGGTEIKPGGGGGVTTGNVDPGAITTPKRQAQGSQSFSYSLSANQKATPTTITHGIGAIPNATFDSGNNNGDFAVWLTNLTTTQMTLCGLNISASPISGVATVYFW